MSRPDHENFNILQSILESSPVGIIIFALDKNYCYSAFSRFHKETIKKIWGTDISLGLNMLDIISYPEDREKAKSNFDKALNGQSLEISEEYGDSGRLRTCYKNYYSPVKNSQGEIVGVSVFVVDITETEKSHQALKDSEKKYRLLAENTSDGILVISADTKIQYVSPSYLKQLGYSENEELGRDSKIIYSEIHPDDRDPLFADIFGAMHNKMPELVYRYRVMHKNGHYIWREDHAKFNYDSSGNHLDTYVICRDISERVNSGETIRKLQKAVESSSACILITDSEGHIEYANPYFSVSTGYTFEEYIGKNPRLLKTEIQDESFYKNLWDTIKSGKTWEGEFCNRKKNGETFWERAIISPITDNLNNITHFVAVKTDISDIKKIQEDLISEKKHAEESDRLKSSFLANISHEIRTPMNGILGFSELLKDPQLSGEKQLEFIAIIEKSGHRMINTINSIVEISKIEAGKLEVDIQETDINSHLHSLYFQFKTEVEQKGLHFSLNNTFAHEETVIITDPGKLDIILSNLIKNAVKFSDKGAIEFGYRKTGKLLEFYVKDTGIGIPKDRQKAIFERFVQADIGDKRAFQGTGLGLSIAKAYVEILGGKLWLESDEGKGSVFYFNIPCIIRSEGKCTEILPHLNGKDLKPKKLKILVVEDDEISRLFLIEALRDYGDEFLHAASGIEAVNFCRDNHDIDLVLMDIRMPGMDGYEATRKIRLQNKNLIIIAQTAHGLGGDREKAIEAGCNDYISKPVDRIRLAKLVQKFFYTVRQ
jgi:PAS domain S-box-containing protein